MSSWHLFGTLSLCVGHVTIELILSILSYLDLSSFNFKPAVLWTQQWSLNSRSHLIWASCSVPRPQASLPQTQVWRTLASKNTAEGTTQPPPPLYFIHSFSKTKTWLNEYNPVIITILTLSYHCIPPPEVLTCWSLLLCHRKLQTEGHHAAGICQLPVWWRKSSCVPFSVACSAKWV